MTNLNSFNSQNNAGSASGFRLASKSGMAMISGLLISSLLVVGCSKEKTTAASGETQTSANQTTLNPPMTTSQMASTVEGTPAVTSAPKQVVKKRPLMVNYKDQTYGVSFRYQRNYGLKSGEGFESASVPMNFVQPGGVTTVAVEVPKGFYPDTDLASAFFFVNVNKNLSEAECGQFAVPQALASGNGVVQPAKMALGGLELQEVEDISGEEMKQADTKYYHLYQNNACYEFALGLSTESAGDDETVKPVSREKVFRRLETILATVKIKPVADAQVATGGTVTPTGQTSASANAPVASEEVK